MDFLRSGFKSVLGSGTQPEAQHQPSAADTVERLIDRVQSSTLLEDRRDACRALKALSKKYRLEVGAQGLGILSEVLHVNQSDNETASYCLETLCNITSPETFDEEEDQKVAVGEQFTEIFLKKTDNVSNVILLLEEYDFRVRLPAIHLLTNLLSNKPKEMQEIILVSPMGVSKLMDILSDTRDFVRNEALLLLAQLTKSNANIQKIVAFENGFDRIFDVIRDEGYSDGGVVAMDCLQLLLNLLKNNASNQTFFREGSYIKRMSGFFNQSPSEENEQLDWNPQKAKNMLLMLQVVRTLVSPLNPSQVVSPAQAAMAHCGLLSSICNLLMASGVPVEVLSETINCVAEIVRGCRPNQDAFSQLMAPSNPPRPVLVVLLLSMVNEKQPFQLRTAVLYAFESYLYKNDHGQSQIIQTLLPTSAEAVPTVTAGQLLCGGLFSTDPVSHWLVSVALSHALVNSPANKEMLLKVQLATSLGAPPVSLMQLCFDILLQGGKVQSKLGILILLSHWLAQCPAAVAQFVKIPNAVSFLTAQVSSNEHDDHEVLVQGICAFLLGLCVIFNNNSVADFTKELLCQLLTKRVGVETFVNKLAETAKHESYAKAAKHPQIKVPNPQDLLLDYEFCLLFKTFETSVTKEVAVEQKGGESPSETDVKIVAQYKEVIREQDAQIQHLRQRLANLDSQYISAQSEIEELKASVQQLQDQNALLKAQRSNNVAVDETLAAAASRHGTTVAFQDKQDPREDQQDPPELLAKIQALSEENHQLRNQLKEKELHIQQMNGEASANRAILESFETTKPANDVQVFSLFRSEAPDADKLALENEVKLLKEQLAAFNLDTEKLQKSETEKLELEEELSKTKKDLEDLFVLLADQDSKLKDYKAKLKNHGENVSDDEDDMDNIDIEELDDEDFSD